MQYKILIIENMSCLQSLHVHLFANAIPFNMPLILNDYFTDKQTSSYMAILYCLERSLPYLKGDSSIRRVRLQRHKVGICNIGNRHSRAIKNDIVLIYSYHQQYLAIGERSKIPEPACYSIASREHTKMLELQELSSRS